MMFNLPSLIYLRTYFIWFPQKTTKKWCRLLDVLLCSILTVRRGGGNVLVAVDTAGRVLELAHMMDQLWGNKASNRWMITKYALVWWLPIIWLDMIVCDYIRTRANWYSRLCCWLSCLAMIGVEELELKQKCRILASWHTVWRSWTMWPSTWWSLPSRR